MNETLSLALTGLQADMARVDRVAANLSQAQTTGYKREIASFAGAMAAVDLRPGTLRSTGQPLDLALAGPGWFEVTTPQGPAYTRAGDFRLDAQGRLVTRQGHPVVGTSGEVQLAHGQPVVDQRGRVFDGAPGAIPSADPMARLKVVQFREGTAFHRLGEGLVGTSEPGATAAEGDVEVRQGHLENSNVSAMEEMVQLIATMRHFEAVQKALVGYDEMLAGAIRRLGDGA